MATNGEFDLNRAAIEATQIYYSDLVKVDGIMTASENYKLGFLKALELVEAKLKAETDPDSWGTFALPTVMKIITKLKESK